LVGALVITVAMSSQLGCDSKQRARSSLDSHGVTDYSQARFLQAVGEADAEVVKLFLDAGMDANAREQVPPGCPAVVAAIRADSAVVLKTLIERGADVNSKCVDGRTPLIYAAKSGKMWGSEILLNAGSAINTLDSDGLTALNYSQFLPEVSSLLQSRGAKIGTLRNIQMLSIDGSTSEYPPHDKRKLFLSATLRNKSDYPSEFPRIRISLSDARDAEVFATVLQPKEYLPTELSPHSVWSPRAAFDIKIELSSPLEATGYKISFVSFDI
jgi:hypothetical protein